MKTLSPAQRRQGHRCPRAPAGGAPHARGGRGRGPSNAAEEEEEDESRELRFEGAGDLQFCRTRPPPPSSREGTGSAGGSPGSRERADGVCLFPGHITKLRFPDLLH